MDSLKIYWAGDLFDHKDIAGNILLAEAAEEVSGGRYSIRLPQDSEANAGRLTDIRDDDYYGLVTADAIVANFDGPDLDSGTVAEFMTAKFLDMPAVLLRTDFRPAGADSGTCPDPWNLMCSNFPRPKAVAIHGLLEYTKASAAASSRKEAMRIYHRNIAQLVVTALDTVFSMPSILTAHEASAQYRTAMRLLGGEMPSLLPDEKTDALVSSKTAKNIYRQDAD